MKINEVCNDLQEKIDDYLKDNTYMLIAIDGRCGSGKSTLATKLGEIYDVKVISLDDFFIPINCKANMPEDINVEYERFLCEVLVPIFQDLEINYQVFDCSTQCYAGKIVLAPQKLYIVEGSYAHHPLMGDSYDLKVVLDIDQKEQRQRIIKRNGEEDWLAFKGKWIPKEEHYFKKYGIMETADVKYTID